MASGTRYGREDDMRGFIGGLPKAELHVHLDGTLEPEMVLTLADRNGVEIPWTSPDDLRAAYSFRGLQSFLDLFYHASRVLVCEQDFYDLTYAYLARAHSETVVRAEMFLGPQNFLERGVSLDAILDGTLGAIDAASRDFGISAGLLITAQRHRGLHDAMDLFSEVQPWADRILGFGLGGAEQNNPPAVFAPFFDECRRAGFRTTAHAGEEGPPSYVRDALLVLEVERIDHGVSAWSDKKLIAQLVSRRIPLTVCPVSNLKLGGVDSLRAHPLRAMLEAGLNVTVNSDDPSYFESYVNDCLWQCHAELGLSHDELTTLARNSLQSTFADPDEVAAWLNRLDSYGDDWAARNFL